MDKVETFEKVQTYEGVNGFGIDPVRLAQAFQMRGEGIGRGSTPSTSASTRAEAEAGVQNSKQEFEKVHPYDRDAEGVNGFKLDQARLTQALKMRGEGII